MAEKYYSAISIALPLQTAGFLQYPILESLGAVLWGNDDTSADFVCRVNTYIFQLERTISAREVRNRLKLDNSKRLAELAKSQFLPLLQRVNTESATLLSFYRTPTSQTYSL